MESGLSNEGGEYEKDQLDCCVGIAGSIADFMAAQQHLWI